MTKFARPLFDADAAAKTASLLQSSLADLIDLSLLLKQAHWNVVGANFLPVHEKLDEIVETTREASDEVAERIVALGFAAEGRVAAVAETTRLAAFPEGFHGSPAIVTAVADRMATACSGLRAGIAELGDLDPISEDLLIGITAELEKHLWMLQATESAG